MYAGPIEEAERPGGSNRLKTLVTSLFDIQDASFSSQDLEERVDAMVPSWPIKGSTETTPVKAFASMDHEELNLELGHLRAPRSNIDIACSHCSR